MAYGICPGNYERLGIPQVFTGSGGGEELCAEYGCGQAAVVAAVKKML